MDIKTCLMDMQYECKLKSVIHNESGKYYERMKYITCGPAMCLVVLCGSSFLSSINFFDMMPKYVIQILIILNFIAVMILTTRDLIDVGKMIDTYYQSSKEYLKLYRIMNYFEKRILTDSKAGEIILDFIFCSMNMIFENEIKCPDNIIKKIYSPDELQLTYLYFDAQTSFKKFKYSKKDIDFLQKLSIPQLMHIIIEDSKKNNWTKKYPYMNFFNTSSSQLIDFIAVELNINPSLLYTYQLTDSFKVNNFVSIAENMLFDDNVVLNMTDTDVDNDKKHKRNLSDTSMRTINCEKDNESMMSTDTDLHRKLRENLESSIVNYYAKFGKSKCKKCGSHC